MILILSVIDFRVVGVIKANNGRALLFWFYDIHADSRTTGYNRGGRYCCMYVGGGMEKGENK
jgi:hypothetical protein